MVSGGSPGSEAVLHRLDFLLAKASQEQDAGNLTPMSPEQRFTAEEARWVGEQIGIDWESAPFDVEQFRIGMEVELEHGTQDSATNVTDDDPIVTGKIALAHLNEFADYYVRLQKMEAEAEGDAGSHG